MFNFLLAGLTLIQSSHATCDGSLRRATTAQSATVVARFQDLVRCDKTVAEHNFHQVMTNATDPQILTALSLAAIDAEIWNPVWTMPKKINSYEARDEVTSLIGGSCQTNPSVSTFLQGAYAGLRDIDFQQWDDAFLACESTDLHNWMVQQIEGPPQRSFDAKYEKLLDIFIKRMGPDSLSHLTTGAIAAAGNDGPYTTILNKMDAAVTPRLGRQLSPETSRLLQDALLQIAKSVPPARAREAAEKLVSSGAEETATSLLPTIFADRMQTNGSFVYGVAAVETGTCKSGVKTAVIHYAEVHEPGTRWVILDDVQAPIREVRARLTRCEIEENAWPVTTTAEPIGPDSEMSAWVSSLTSEWEARGYEVSTRSERDIELD